MKHEYRITLPLGTYTYAKNGVELDQVISNCIQKGATANIQMAVSVSRLPSAVRDGSVEGRWDMMNVYKEGGKQ